MLTCIQDREPLDFLLTEPLPPPPPYSLSLSLSLSLSPSQCRKLVKLTSSMMLPQNQAVLEPIRLLSVTISPRDDSGLVSQTIAYQFMAAGTIVHQYNNIGFTQSLNSIVQLIPCLLVLWVVGEYIMGKPPCL